MALSFNGTTLATNIDAVMFNGTAVSKVMFNGTEVWAKVAELTWSGDSLAVTNNSIGIQVSGNLFRAKSATTTGAWITTQSNGTFVGDSGGGSNNLNLSTSGNLVRIQMSGQSAGNWVTYTLANKGFTGTSQSGFSTTTDNYYYYLQTSGGLIRVHTVQQKTSRSGAYISLT